MSVLKTTRLKETFITDDFLRVKFFRLAALVCNGVQLSSVKVNFFHYTRPFHHGKFHKRTTIANRSNLL